MFQRDTKECGICFCFSLSRAPLTYCAIINNSIHIANLRRICITVIFVVIVVAIRDKCRTKAIQMATVFCIIDSVLKEKLKLIKLGKVG